MHRGWWVLAAAVALGCGGDSPPIVTGSPPDPLGRGVVPVSELIPGPDKSRLAIRNPYEGNKNVLMGGRRYYNWFNCTGCHGGAGGGGIGPPLADADWIYGGDPANIFLSIVQGRPNGMPSYGEQIPDDQVWQIVSYVTSLAEEAGAASREEGEGGGNR